MKYGRLVVVVWDDAWAAHGWTDDTTPKPMTVTTVGWVIQETEVGMSLAQSVAADGFGSVWFIPNGMINSVTYLKEGEPA